MGCMKEGDLDCDDDELPLHRVHVDAFYLDRLEVRVVDYAKCVVAGYCSTRRLKGYALDGGVFTPSNKCNWEQPYREKFPINCVSHAEAESYCEWMKGALPTEAQWERAARGDDRRRYPWGDEPATCLLTVMTEEGDEGCGKKRSWSTGMKARDESPFGARDMAGNVREWVADWYAADFYAQTPTTNPQGPERGVRRGARGGSFGIAVSKLMRISNRESYTPATRSIHLGFRCARPVTAGNTPAPPK
jgi:formylglycine-generating enzyme required for sulfatase activity